jgi:hypothetical protein
LTCGCGFLRPREPYQRRQKTGFCSELVPSDAGRIDHRVVVVEQAVRQVALFQMFPDALDRIDFRRLRRQRQNLDIGGELHNVGRVKALLIHDKLNMLVGRDFRGEAIEELLYVRRVYLRQHKRDLSDKEVMRRLAVVMAEIWVAGTNLIDTLGEILKVDIERLWTPNETFFFAVKDRETVSAMLADVIGVAAAKSYRNETSTKKKAIIRNALAGDGRSIVDGWIPRTMAFPQRGYTQRPLMAYVRLTA